MHTFGANVLIMGKESSFYLQGCIGGGDTRFYCGLVDPKHLSESLISARSTRKFSSGMILQVVGTFESEFFHEAWANVKDP